MGRITAGHSAERRQRNSEDSVLLSLLLLHLSPLMGGGRGFAGGPSLLLLSRTGIRRALAALLALLLDPVHMKGFVLECPGEQVGVSRRVRLDGLAESRVGGGDEVRVILPRPIHDLVAQRRSMSSSKATCVLLKGMCVDQYIIETSDI